MVPKFTPTNPPTTLFVPVPVTVAVASVDEFVIRPMLRPAKPPIRLLESPVTAPAALEDSETMPTLTPAKPPIQLLAPLPVMVLSRPLPVPLMALPSRTRFSMTRHSNESRVRLMVEVIVSSKPPLSMMMSTLGTVEVDVVEDLLLEFVSRMSASGALMGTFDATERLLQQYLPSERVMGIMDEIRGPAGRNMWEKLSNVQEEVLANYLKNEYPQTIAVVLSKLKPEHAARVLAILPEDMALDVVNRMLRMEAVQKEVIERVEQTLRTEFMSNLSQTRRRDAHEVMAEIFNNFDRQTETRFMTSLEEDNRESAERIKTLMFTFDDLTRLDAGSARIDVAYDNADSPSLRRATVGVTFGAPSLRAR